MSILIVQKIIDEVLDRANTDGIEAGRNLYKNFSLKAPFFRYGDEKLIYC